MAGIIRTLKIKMFQANMNSVKPPDFRLLRISSNCEEPQLYLYTDDRTGPAQKTNSVNRVISFLRISSIETLKKCLFLNV